MEADGLFLREEVEWDVCDYAGVMHNQSIASCLVSVHNNNGARSTSGSKLCECLWQHQVFESLKLADSRNQIVVLESVSMRALRISIEG